jgi:hypothetical protein
MTSDLPSAISDTPSAKRIVLLHNWYCAAMGTTWPLGMATERYWFDWMAAGYNGKQLRKVMVWLRKEITSGRRNPGSLKLRNLLNPETFQEDLFLSGANLDPDVKLPPSPLSERPEQNKAKV